MYVVVSATVDVGLLFSLLTEREWRKKVARKRCKKKRIRAAAGSSDRKESRDGKE